jgi:hypothetical protein
MMEERAKGENSKTSDSLDVLQVNFCFKLYPAVVMLVCSALGLASSNIVCTLQQFSRQNLLSIIGM